MTAIYAGVPIDQLRHLPHAARCRLLRVLDAQCSAAAHRNNQILTARRARELAAIAADCDPPRLIDARHAAIDAAVTWRHPTTTRRTA